MAVTLVTRALVGRLRSLFVRRRWLLGFLCAGCTGDPALTASVAGAGAGGSGGTEPFQSTSSAGASGTFNRGPVNRRPDYCYNASIDGYCGSSGCPSLQDYVAQLLEHPPQELFVLPCGDGSRDAGSVSEAGDASLGDAGPSGTRYAVVLSSTGTNTDEVYYDTRNGQAVAATRRGDPFTICAPMYPIFGEIPNDCTTLGTERCPPRDAGADAAASVYTCLLL